MVNMTLGDFAAVAAHAVFLTGSVALVLAITSAVGAVVLMIMRYVIPNTTIGLINSTAIGLLVVINILWYSLILGVLGSTALQYSFVAIFLVGTALLIIQHATPIGQRAPIRFQTLPEIYPYFIYVLLAAVFLCSFIQPGQMDIVSIGNNDVYNYASLSDFLLSRDRFGGGIGNLDFTKFIQDDVFGAHSLLALTGFITNKDTIQVTLVPLAAAIAFVAYAVRQIARDVYRMPSITSYFVGIFSVANPLFVYSVMNFFLSQIMAVAATVSYILAILTLRFKQNRSRGYFYVSSSALYICIILYTYPAAFPHTLLVTFFSILFCGYFTNCEPYPPSLYLINLKALSRAIYIAIFFSILALLVSLLISPIRASKLIGTLIYFSTPGVAGWSFPLVQPEILAGIFSWPPSSNFALDWPKWLAYALFIGLLWIAAWRLGASKQQHPLLNLPLAIYTASVVAYCAVFLLYRESYQQWKFAATYVAPYAWCILLPILYYARNLRWRAIWIAIDIAFCAAISIQALLLSSYWEVYRQSKDFERLAAVNELRAVRSVVVDLGDYRDNMLASTYIKRKETLFEASSYYRTGKLPSQLKPGGFYLKRDQADCNYGDDSIRLEGHFVLAKERAPTLTSAQTVDFSKAHRCVMTSGLSEAENWGTWTDSRKATVDFDLDPKSEPAPNAIELKVRPFLVPNQLSKQHVIITINGDEAFNSDLTEIGDTILQLPLPEGARGKQKVVIDIELPDAHRPSDFALSADNRLIGIGLVSMKLLNR